MRNIIFLLLFILSGCSFLSPVAIPPQSLYELNPTIRAPHCHAGSKINRMQVKVMVNSIYDGNQIAYTKTPYQIAYFTRHQWVNSPSEMIQQNLNKHFNSSPVLKTSNILLINLLVFKINLTENIPYFELSATLSHLNVKSNTVIKSKTITIHEPMQTLSNEAGVDAANRALAKLIQSSYALLNC